MPPLTTLVILLALLLYARRIDTERRQLRAALRHDHLTRRLNAINHSLPQVSAQYGQNSPSARYLRATQYLTSLELRHLTPRRATIGGGR